jgi:hypothetical protein
MPLLDFCSIHLCRSSIVKSAHHLCYLYLPAHSGKAMFTPHTLKYASMVLLRGAAPRMDEDLYWEGSRRAGITRS